MIEYKVTRQAVDMEWPSVSGAAARELTLHPPSGEDWTLHSFEHGEQRVVAVWSRTKRAHEMSEVYLHSDSGSSAAAEGPVKTVADIPEPHA